MRVNLFKITAVMLAVIVCFLSSGCASSKNLDQSLRKIISPYSFNLALWEAGAVRDEMRQLISNRHEDKDNEIGRVKDYFAITSRINVLTSEIEAVKGGLRHGDLALLQDELEGLHGQKLALEGQIERIIEKQIRATLSEQGIYNPLDEWLKLKAGFPPVNFKLAEPPYLLVISPKDKIETVKTVMLKPTMTDVEIEALESKVDGLGVSSLVVKIGGVATYPAFVSNSRDLRSTLDTVSEEWLHQYLAFRPLGFRYLLNLSGISKSYEMVTINETVASMLSQEIGALVFENYYTEASGVLREKQQIAEDFDFNREMREIRKAVDFYLAQGKIDEAEDFMAQKRQELASHGYYIRKLNQAYFAFYGCYADSPTSVDPIGVELRELRSKSASIKDFLDRVSAMTSREELERSIR